MGVPAGLQVGHVDQQAARRVRAGGAIVNFASSVVNLSLPTYAGYAATKGAVEATIERMAAQPPLERLGVPADIAEVIAFLAGPGRWINGQVLRANGGIV